MGAAVAITAQPSEIYALTVHDAAAYLGESLGAVYRMCKRREIDHLRTRGRLKFSQAGLAAWVAAHRVPPTAAGETAGRRARPQAAPVALPMPTERRFS